MKISQSVPALLLSSLCCFGFSECGPSTPGIELPPPPNPLACENLDEPSCTARMDCRAEYEQESCACAPCLARDDGDAIACPECNCPDPTFAACHSVGPCAGLSEAQCIADAQCEPIYGTPPCACTACDTREPTGPDGFRAPPCECECAQVETYQGCQLSDPCEGLGEAQCIAAPGCTPLYRESYCGGRGDALIPCEGDDCGAPCEGPGCPAPCMNEVQYDGCSSEGPVCPAVLCEIACQFGNEVDANGCGTCGCNPPPDECATLDEQSCLQTGGCEARYESSNCGGMGGDSGGARPCDPSQGESCDPAPCDPITRFAGCFASETKCPELEGGHVSYVSHDPTQCAAIDYDCGAGWTSFYSDCGCGCIGPMEPPPPVCSDGSEVLCDAIPPECPIDTVIGIQNGCWSCVEPFSCQAVICRDGSELACRALPPICDDDQGLSIQNGCWSCVDPNTCN